MPGLRPSTRIVPGRRAGTSRTSATGWRPAPLPRAILAERNSSTSWLDETVAIEASSPRDRRRRAAG